MPDLHTIVLAGGRSERMGCDKATVTVAGARLIDVLLNTLARPVTVVHPGRIDLPVDVALTCEEPAFGGPVAGIAAAFDPDFEYTAILAVDAPHSGACLPRLRAALEANGLAQVAQVEGEPLCALWRSAGLRDALEALGSPRNRSARKLIAQARATSIPADGSEADYDTPEDLLRFPTHRS